MLKMLIRVAIDLMGKQLFLFRKEFNTKELRIRSLNEISEGTLRLLAVGSGEMNRIASPQFFSRSGIHPKYPPINSKNLPSGIMTLSNKTVISRTEFVISEGQAFIPENIKLDTDYLTCELEEYARIDRTNLIAYITLPFRQKKVKEAISVFGQANGNYAHFVIEALARVCIADQMNVPSQIPIIIESNLHPKLYEALDQMNFNRRPVIRIKPYRRVKVEKLIYVLPPSYTPSEKIKQSDLTRFEFSRESMDCLIDSGKRSKNRTKSKSAVYIEPFKYMDIFGRDPLERQFASMEQSVAAGEKVMLVRNAKSVGNGRFLVNQTGIMDYLIEIGFSVFDIAEMKFNSQIAQFENTKIVVSPIGASLINTIFSPRPIDVIILSPFFKGADYNYFSGLLGMAGHRVHFVLGNQTISENHHNTNADFYVSELILDKALSQIK